MDEDKMKIKRQQNKKTTKTTNKNDDLQKY